MKLWRSEGAAAYGHEVLEKRKRNVRENHAQQWRLSRICIVVAVILYNLYGGAEELHPISAFLRFEQSWDMFAPSPIDTCIDNVTLQVHHPCTESVSEINLSKRAHGEFGRSARRCAADPCR